MRRQIERRNHGCDLLLLLSMHLQEWVTSANKNYRIRKTMRLIQPLNSR